MTKFSWKWLCFRAADKVCNLSSAITLQRAVPGKALANWTTYRKEQDQLKPLEASIFPATSGENILHEPAVKWNNQCITNCQYSATQRLFKSFQTEVCGTNCSVHFVGRITVLQFRMSTTESAWQLKAHVVTYVICKVGRHAQRFRLPAWQREKVSSNCGLASMGSNFNKHLLTKARPGKLDALWVLQT